MKEHYKKIALINGLNVTFHETVLSDHKCKYDIKSKPDKESAQKHVPLAPKLLRITCLAFSGKLKATLIITHAKNLLPTTQCATDF